MFLAASAAVVGVVFVVAVEDDLAALALIAERIDLTVGRGEDDST